MKFMKKNINIIGFEYQSFVNSDDCSAYFLSKFDGVDLCSQTGEKINCPSKNVKKIILIKIYN